MTREIIEKLDAELPILRRFMDFVNQQVGVYCDCLSSFSGNEVRVKRQVPRVQRPTGRTIKDGAPVIVWASVEDPSLPDVIHHRIIHAHEFVAANAEAGFNEQQVCRAIIVFVFAYWNEQIRPELARARGVEPNDVKLDALGDLRILRHSIVHDSGHVSAAEHAKLKVMHELVKADASIALTHDQMHKVFVFVKQAIAQLILEHTGHIPGAPKASDLVGLAIETRKRSTD
jgi:hypothetical protein